MTDNVQRILDEEAERRPGDTRRLRRGGRNRLSPRFLLCDLAREVPKISGSFSWSAFWVLRQNGRQPELIVRGPDHAPHRLRSRVAPDLCAFHGPPRVLDEAGARGVEQERSPGFLLARAFDARLDVVGCELAADACFFDGVPERSAGEGSPVLVGASFDAFERFVSGDKSKMKLASHVDPLSVVLPGPLSSTIVP